MPLPQYGLQVTSDALALIIDQLGEQPYKKIKPLIESLEQQRDMQDELADPQVIIAKMAKMQQEYSVLEQRYLQAVPPLPKPQPVPVQPQPESFDNVVMPGKVNDVSDATTHDAVMAAEGIENEARDAVDRTEAEVKTAEKETSAV